MKKSNRQLARERQQRQKRKQYMTWGAFSLTVLAVIVAVLLINRGSFAGTASSGSGLMGQAVQVDSRDHVADSTVPGPYHSNPPAGGSHFAETLPAKFYQESDLTDLGAHPEGHLVHNLEHGYVIFWYNCQALAASSGTDCTGLKNTIQQVMNQTGQTKLIAFPWSSQDVPLAMTSWGRILKFNKIDAAQMAEFVNRNRYQAPEPDGK
jgi:hypothetical protein